MRLEGKTLLPTLTLCNFQSVIPAAVSIAPALREELRH